MAPNPVIISAIVPGSGTVVVFACPPKFNPPGQQLFPTQEKPIEKLCPFPIPLSGLSLPLIPDSTIATFPFFRFVAVQLINRVELQLMALAGTWCPISTRVSEVQFTPLAFVKNKLPVPPAGTPKVKFKPTFLHPSQDPNGMLALLAL